jgi:tRNA G18 (ribose-2'-O)-methylase SpoU
MTDHYQIRQCQNERCRFRFPLTDNRLADKECPWCGSPTSLANNVRPEHEVAPWQPAADEPALEALLDNIRSIYNVGSMFRTADAAGISHLHLCGISATPKQAKVAKTALGAEQAVPWTHYRNGVDAAVALKQRGYRLWAIEGGPQAESLFQARGMRQGWPIVLVVGNEVTGVDPAILQQCDQVLSIPMHGRKRSLNVAVAFGIAVYYLRHVR